MVWKAVDRRSETVQAEDAPELSEQTLGAINDLLGRYPTRRAVLLPALHLVQDQIGWIPLKAQLTVAELIGIPPSEVLDVVTFYEMFWPRPRGRQLIQVCESFCCELCGQSGLLEAIEKRLNIRPGETTPDGQFTLITVQCLAACDKAPVVLVNDRLFDHVTPDRLDAILRDQLTTDFTETH